MAGPISWAQTISVSSGGKPVYGYPIQVPPGIAGMAPNLSLQYSGGINGPVGVGWSLQGVSMITRCPYNKRLDGVVRNVKYDDGDRLCLDGQRLIRTDAAGTQLQQLMSDALGGSSADALLAEYRTEKDVYARIRAYGVIGTCPRCGPGYFKVWTKSGQVFEYGVKSNATSNATILAVTTIPRGTSAPVMAWAVSRIADTLGNYIDFQYEQRNVAAGSWQDGTSAALGREWNLLEVRYTGTSGQAPANRVSFEYSERALTGALKPDVSETYHAGQKNVSVKRLDAIRTYVGTTGTAVNVKTIKLGYDNSANTKRSRLISITECAGSSSNCLPAASFAYTPGGTASYTRNPQFASLMSTVTLLSNSTGVLIGNFMGSGRSDILRWSDSAVLNQLYQNTGNGNFSLVANGSGAGKFNIIDRNLFKTDGCYKAIAADFNGDGLTDILSVMRAQTAAGASCGTVTNKLYLSNGDGSFLAVDLNGIDFSQIESTVTDTYRCDGDQARSLKVGKSKAPRLKVGAKSGPSAPLTPIDTGGNCGNGQPQVFVGRSQTAGSTFHLLDVNNDGLLDIVTTMVLGYDTTTSIPTDAELCTSITCTRVYLGQGNGSFAENTATNLAHASVYSDPTTTVENYWRRPFVGDVDGDGIADLLVDSGTYISSGDGNFSNVAAGTASNPGCQNLLDFNGDGKMDCLSRVDAFPGAQSMSVSVGTVVPVGVGNFNLISSGNELYGVVPNTTIQTVGTSLVDVDGDGRTDILRWENDPSKNTIYLSNGDGTFRTSDFNLTTANDRLQNSDGSVGYVVGDFTGNGNAEILRMVVNPSSALATSNVLYVKQVTSPPDFLATASTGTGLKTTLTWTSLSGGGSGTLGARYYSDRKTGNAASYPVYDLMLPMYVVATSSTDVGIGSRQLVTEYRYAGLKSSYDGRGWLGFREMRRQSIAPDGSNVTVASQYVQDGLNSSAVARSVTWVGDLNRADAAPYLSRTTNTYCDRTAAGGAEAAATVAVPCPTTSLVRRPYLYKSVEEGWEPAVSSNNALPTVTTQNTFNDSGDATQIVVTTAGTAVGLAQTASKTVINTYDANVTSGDSWILGRLKKTTVNNVVPDNFDSIVASAGTLPTATLTTGVLMTVAVTPSPLLVNSTVPAASGSVTASAGGGSEPYTYAWVRIAGTRSNISSATAANPTFSAALIAGDNFTETWKVTARDASGNTADTPVNVSFVMPSAALAVSASASPSTVTASAPGPASGSASATASGGKAPYAYAWTRLSGARLSISDASAQSPGFSANLAVGDSFSETWSVRVTDAAAKTASASVALNFVGPTALSASVSPASLNLSTGTAGALSGSVQVNASGGSAPYSYSWSRTAGTRSSVSNGTIANPSFSATVAAGDAFTETWRVTVSDGSGQNTSASISVTFNGPTTTPALALLNCSSVTPTISPAQASTTCSVKNTGTGAASSISYAGSSVPGATITGPTGSCAAGTVCGSAVVTSGSNPGSYAGTLVASPSSGTSASASISLQVNAGTPSVTADLTSWNFGSLNFNQTAAKLFTVTNSGNGPASGVSTRFSPQVIGTSSGVFSINYDTCSGTIAAGATCTIRVRFEANCLPQAYNATLYIEGLNFPTVPVTFYASTAPRGVCILVTPPAGEGQ